MKIADSADIRRIENEAMKKFSISSLELMERAGAFCAGVLGDVCGQRISVLAGRGNNGGDGFVTARYLKERGALVQCFLFGGTGSLSEETDTMYKRFSECGGETILIKELSQEVKEKINDSSIIVDAMFGIGLSRPVGGIFLETIQYVNSLNKFVLSVDIPSGVDADRGRIMTDAIKATKTATFLFYKPAHFLSPARNYAKEVLLDTIGIDEGYLNDCVLPVCAADESLLKDNIKIRDPETHKGNYGKVLTVCGGRGYTGAAYFAAQAAVVSGSGLVFCAVPESVYSIVATKLNEPVIFSVADCDGHFSKESLQEILNKMEMCDAILIGPGIGVSPETEYLVTEVLKNAHIPVVIDADGINIISRNINLLKHAGSTWILTPHEVEFLRLLSGEHKDQNRQGEACEFERSKISEECGGFDRMSAAREFSERYHCTLLLKGHRTITASEDGRVYINTTGNPGMAKGGSGDILSGIILSLLGQGVKPFIAAACGAYIHGRAGDICANTLGEYSMTPTDMLKSGIPEVLLSFNGRAW